MILGARGVLLAIAGLFATMPAGAAEPRTGTADELGLSMNVTRVERAKFRGGATGFLVTITGADPDDPIQNTGRVTCKPAKGAQPEIFWIMEDGITQQDIIRPGKEDEEPRYIQGSYELWYYLCGRRR